MKNLTMKEAQKIIDDAPKGETHFYVSRLLRMGEVAYFSRDDDGIFAADKWVVHEMHLGCKHDSLDELRAHLAFLTAMNDMREDDNKELIEQIKTIEHVMEVQQKSINWLVDSNAELLAEKQKLERELI